MIGERLGEHLLLARIGRGGMGAVYLAEDPAGERVAVKLLEARDGELEAGLRRFAQELDVLRRVEHPRIVRALGPLERQGERCYFAMEYVRGRNLAQVLREHGRLEPPAALAIVSGALEGLIAAHGAGILHRDLKSANLLVDGAGRAKVCDFGLARAVDHTRLTLSGNVLGTPAYLSPEQARGHESRVESDLYSLGVVLYEALTGTLPFQAETPLALLRQHLDDVPDPPSSRRPDLPPDLDGLVLRALAKAPAARWPSAEAMRTAVEGLRAGLAADDPRGALSTVIQRRLATETQALEAQVSQTLGAGRRRWAPAVALTLAAGLGGVLWLRGGPTAAPTSAAIGRSPAAVDSAADAPASQGDAAPASTVATLELTDGRTLVGALVAIADGQVTVRDRAGVLQTVPRKDVRSIGYAEPR